MDSQTKELEPQIASTVTLNQEFGFFNQPVASGDDEIVQTADIKNKQGQEPIGGLIGRAQKPADAKITGNDFLHVTFEIRKNAEKQGQTAQNLEGQALENPAIFMETPNGLFASMGEKEGTNINSFGFTNWVEIKKPEDATKFQINKMIDAHKAQPRTLRLSELQQAKFKIT